MSFKPTDRSSPYTKDSVEHNGEITIPQKSVQQHPGILVAWTISQAHSDCHLLILLRVSLMEQVTLETGSFGYKR